MAKDYYECHITLESKHPHSLRETLEALGWKFSAVDGDPNLGSGVKCYATRQYNSERVALHHVIEIVKDLAENLRLQNYKVLREKVELVVYDSHSVTVRPDACDFTDAQWEAFERGNG